MSDDSSARVVSHWLGVELATAEYLTVDWNIVMRRVNAQFDNSDWMYASQPPKQLSLGNLFIGERSRCLADLIGSSSLR